MMYKCVFYTNMLRNDMIICYYQRDILWKDVQSGVNYIRREKESGFKIKEVLEGLGSSY